MRDGYGVVLTTAKSTLLRARLSASLPACLEERASLFTHPDRDHDLGIAW